MSDPAFPPGTRVRVARPESPDSFRRGQVGTVRAVARGPVLDQYGKPRTEDLSLHTVDFDTDVPGVDSRRGVAVNFGRVPWVGLGRCLDPVTEAAP